MSSAEVPAANLHRAAVLVPDAGRPVIAVDGVDGAGKTTFADALADLLRREDRHVVRASIDGFHHPLAHRRAEAQDSGGGVEPSLRLRRAAPGAAGTR